MLKFIAVFLILLVGTPDALACRIGQAPDAMQSERYSSIYIIEVTGVHLTGYERSKLIDAGALVLEPPPPGLEALRNIVNYTPSFHLSAWVERVVKGPPAHTASVELGGCFVPTPNLHARGLLFIEAASGKALAVWDDRPEVYQETLRALGVGTANEP